MDLQLNEDLRLSSCPQHQFHQDIIKEEANEEDATDRESMAPKIRAPLTPTKTSYHGDRWELVKKRAALMKRCLTQAFTDIHQKVIEN